MMSNHTLGPCHRKVRGCKKHICSFHGVISMHSCVSNWNRRLFVKTEIQKAIRCSATAIMGTDGISFSHCSVLHNIDIWLPNLFHNSL